MKFKITERKNGTKRYQSVPKGPSLTDQSDKNYLDINNIMKNYAKTGILPQFQEKVAHYIDATELPSYIEAHAQIKEAKELFNAIPANIRKLMDNNPKNLEPFLKNPENKELLYKYGLLEAPEYKKGYKSQKDEGAGEAASESQASSKDDSAQAKK